MAVHGTTALSLVLMVLWADLSAQVVADSSPRFESIQVATKRGPTPATIASSGGFSLIAHGDGPQLAVMTPARTLLVSLRRGEEVEVTIAVQNVDGPCELVAEATLIHGTAAHVSLSLGDAEEGTVVETGHPVRLALALQARAPGSAVVLTTRTSADAAAVRWRRLELVTRGQSLEIPLSVNFPDPDRMPPPVVPNLRKPIEQALIEWDWRRQDGIGTERAPETYRAAVQRTLARGDCLYRDLQAAGRLSEDLSSKWQALRRACDKLSAANTSQPQWEDLWQRVHWLRRRIALSNPRAQVGPLLLVKQPTATFSHQLTQYLGRYARPGGGIFVLDQPGQSMLCRQLAPGALPEGSFQHPEVSFAADRVLFSYCQADSSAPPGIAGEPNRHYHLYEMSVDGSDLRQVTDGPYDDFSPRYLPNGQIVFISTRRGGWHRCGGSPGRGCENHTLALAEPDGSNPRPISFHETHEWDPAVLNDGRIIYTRWDYVDRHAVYYEQLWTARPDGTQATIYFGNNTFNPVGIWEARPIPDSVKVMATAAAHHAMTAGSIVLVDVTKGVDGLTSISRLTPDALFPESETRVRPRAWHAPAGIQQPPPVPREQRRWPGHCYKSPYPLSETYFLAAYSFEALIGEPDSNPANMFGIYLVDRFGNKELLYRDLNISSLWPVPLRPRWRPPKVPAMTQETDKPQGVLLVQNVYASFPPLPPEGVQRLRIVQVLPKSTPGINWPRVGIPNASPGKQVLGTVPVEPDGSAHFRAPAGIPISLQALDARGQAVQTMRSVVYLQPGETLACVGCHEPRNTTPPSRRVAQALLRPASTIQPAPEGSNPLSYPILVQPVLDKHCVHCHSGQKPDGDVVLTGRPQGHFSVSYNTLAPRVTHSAWGGKPGNFRVVNSEPLSQPGFFGALSSPWMQMLLKGHYDVLLGDEDIERLATWMDANVLFYGTFNHADQARQQRGLRIEGPDLQ